MAAQRLRENWIPPYTWEAAEDTHMSASWANIHLRDLAGHIKRPPIIQLGMSTGHKIQKDWTAVRWNKIVVDNWSQANTGSDVVLPIRGHWLITACVGFDGGRDGARAVRILHDGISIGEDQSPSSSDGGPLNMVNVLAFANAGAGDTITIEAWSSAEKAQVSVKAKQPKSALLLAWQGAPRKPTDDPSAPIRSLTTAIGAVSSAMGGKPILPPYWLNIPVRST